MINFPQNMAFCKAIVQNKQCATILLQRTFFFPINRHCRASLPLSKQSMGVLSGGEIHWLRRLRDEGFPGIP